MNNEPTARIKINNLLISSGWKFFDDDEGEANISLEAHAKISENTLTDMGEDFENISNGYIDFLLLDNNSKPLLVLEAKKSSLHPLDGKEQARKYANSLNVKYIILSNGDSHYFWNLDKGNPEIIHRFPTPTSIQEERIFSEKDKKSLNEINIDEFFLANVQNNNFQEDPEYKNKASRNDFIKNNDLTFLRKYQIEAIQAIQKEFDEGKKRFLLEMATGTGKTTLAAAIINLFFKTNNAKRALFLVDRIELEKNAFPNLHKHLSNDLDVEIFKLQSNNWRSLDVVISTTQTLLSRNKYLSLFSHTDFDLIISDEAHRSINGNARAMFEYFDGYKIGLTATPKDYLKNLNLTGLDSSNQKVMEQRELHDTYRTFECTNREPTYRYSLADGVRDGFLVNPVLYDLRTEITTQLLSDEGLEIEFNDSDEDPEKQTKKVFRMENLEKTIVDENTNKAMCEALFKHLKKDPVTEEIGKTIIFCVSQDHARKITQYMNEYVETYYPDQYSSDFAVQITSRIPNNSKMSENFKHNNLNGKSKWIKDYDTSKTRIVTTVSMMSTGFDCTDLLNVVLMKPIFSPASFIQHKGRGTRIEKFKYPLKENKFIEKDTFHLIDFFGVCEYFEEKYDYSEPISQPPKSSGPAGGGGETIPVTKLEIFDEDELVNIEKTHVPDEGMKVDQKLYSTYKESIKDDKEVSDVFMNNGLKEAASFVNKKYEQEIIGILNYLEDENVLNRRVSVEELVESIFLFESRIKSKNQLINDEYTKFIKSNPVELDHEKAIKYFFHLYSSDSEFKKIIKEKDFQTVLNQYPFSVDELELISSLIPHIQEYIDTYVDYQEYGFGA